MPQSNSMKDVKKLKYNQYIILLFLTLLAILSITLLSRCLLLPDSEEFQQQGQGNCTLGEQKPCQSGWTHYEGSCYKIFPNQKRTWYDAEFFCIQHMNHCHLPSVHSEWEYQFLLNLWTNPRQKRIWLGGKYSLLKDKTVWTDETSWDFAKFADGEPNNHKTTEGCIEYRGGLNGWNDTPCESKLSVLCKCRSKTN